MYDIDLSIIGSIPNINYKWKIKGAILASLYNAIVILKQVQCCGSLSGVKGVGPIIHFCWHWKWIARKHCPFSWLYLAMSEGLLHIQDFLNHTTMGWQPVVQSLRPSLCHPMNCSTPGFPVHHCLPEFAQTHVHWVILSGAVSPSFPSNLLDTYWLGGGSSSSVISFCPFILFVGFSRQAYWSGLPFPSPVEHNLSELSAMTCLYWVALHGLFHSFLELGLATCVPLLGHLYLSMVASSRNQLQGCVD